MSFNHTDIWICLNLYKIGLFKSNSQSNWVCVWVNKYTHIHRIYTYFYFLLYLPFKVKDETYSYLVDLSLHYFSFTLPLVLAFINANLVLGSCIKPTCIAHISGFLSRPPQKQTSIFSYKSSEILRYSREYPIIKSRYCSTFAFILDLWRLSYFMLDNIFYLGHFRYSASSWAFWSSGPPYY